MKNIQDRALGLAFGTAIGDAMGIPFENLTPTQIASIQMSLKSNESLFVNAAGRNPHISKDWQTGRWGDATQLSLAIMHAITKHLSDKSEEISLIQHIVNEHIREWRTCTDGWGDGTKNAMEKIAHRTCSYLNSGGISTGNGVIMKLTPLAFYFFILNKEIDEELIEQLCRMTHSSSVTVTTALIYIYLCTFLFKNNFPSTHEEKITFLQYAQQLSTQYELRYKLITEKDLLSIRIQHYLENIDNITNEVLITVSQGGTYFCVDTLTMVIGLIVQKSVTFKTIENAIEMGGDTNIVAAMIGALLGAIQGLSAIDDRRVKIVYQSEYIQQIGEHFGHALSLLETNEFYC